MDALINTSQSSLLTGGLSVVARVAKNALAAVAACVAREFVRGVATVAFWVCETVLRVEERAFPQYVQRRRAAKTARYYS